MKIKLYTNFADLHQFKNQWNELVQKNETNTVFQLFEWIMSWWNIYGNENLILLAAFEKDKIIGVAPLMKIDYGFTKNMIQFIGEGRADYSDFIVPENKKEIIESFLDFLLKNTIQWNSLHLNQIPDQSSTNNILTEFCKKENIKYLIRRKINCPNIQINDQNHLEKIFKKRTLRRRFNYFKKNGSLEFNHIEDIDEVYKNLESFFEQHIKRVKLKNISSLFVDEKNREFYQEMVKNMYNTKYIKFSRLDFNDTPIAFHFGFEYANKYMWYKPTFNVKYKKYSPGNVLFKYLLEYSIKNHLDIFDFTVGDGEFKNRYANNSNQNIQIEIYNNNFVYFYELFKLKVNRIVNSRN